MLVALLNTLKSFSALPYRLMQGQTLLLSLSLLLCAATAQAETDAPTFAPMSRPKTAGWVEKVVLMPFGDTVKAKLDTGATTSSIHTQALKRFTRNGEKWVSFELQYKTVDGENKTQLLERPVFRNMRVKEHDGDNGRRPVVELKFCFNQQEHSAQFSLVDRSKFVYPVLLGRRFLAGVTVVDSAKTFITEASCGTASKLSATNE